ncbi:MAG: hypothetical protein ACJAWH_000925 [Maribacter sp.]|jgi:hypothetical protein
MALRYKKKIQPQKKVSQENVDKIIEAARWVGTSSACNNLG